VWVAGIALVQLLVIGVGAALLWPNEAEAAAARIRKGMTLSEAEEALGRHGGGLGGSMRAQGYQYPFEDGSCLTLSLVRSGLWEPWDVGAFWTEPPTPVHPLTRLRRTLARVIPALGE
jgi:hypothetical protein